MSHHDWPRSWPNGTTSPSSSSLVYRVDDDELLWEPAPSNWSVKRLDDGSTRPTSESAWWAPDSTAAPPRTLAWSMGHLAAGSLIRADWLVGAHEMTTGPDWPVEAAAAVAFLREGLDAWRSGLEEMSDEDLYTVG